MKKIKLNIKNKLHLLFLWLLAGSVHSQQLPLSSQYYLNQFIYNPAATGSENYSKVFIIHRDQWTAIPGMPTSNSATFDTPINKKKIGLGVSIHSEAKGFSKRMGAYGYYSYKINLSDSGKLTFGISLGVLNERMNFSTVLVQNQNDPYLINAPQQNTSIDAKAGVLYNYRNFELGASILQLAGNSFQNSSYNTLNNMNRSFYITSKYTLLINKKKNITAYPFLMSRINPGSPLQYDINLIVDWGNVGWLGTSYRSNYAIGLNAGIRLFRNLNIGYAYDVVINQLSSYGGLSHEIVLAYLFKTTPKQEYKKEVKEISKNLKKRGDSIIKQLNNCFERKEHATSKEELQLIEEEIEKYKQELEKMRELIDKKRASDSPKN